MLKNISKYYLIIFSLIAYGFIAINVPQNQASSLFFLVSLLFLCYALGINKNIDIKWAYLYRILFLFAIPLLSDDFWRFLWDGQLILDGHNPYSFKPIDLKIKTAYQEALFSKLNSKEYYSVYPPINQITFIFGALLSKNSSILGGIIGLRLILFLSELGSIKLIKKHFGAKTAYIYAFNPLIIIELNGNLHFEALVIFFLLLSYHLLKEKKSLLSGAVFGLSVGVKLIPLLLLPILILRHKKYKIGPYFFLALLIVLGLLLISIGSLQNLKHFYSSIRLYFKTFEFNASIYFLLNKIGYLIYGYNTISFVGPFLGLISTVGILFFSFRSGKLLESLLYIFTIYYLLSTTVHPWYISYMVLIGAIGLFTYPLIWSYLVFLSYFFYSDLPETQFLYILIIEYAVLAFFIFTSIQKKKNPIKSSLLD